MSRLQADKNRRILVIDDNRAIHDDFRKILCPAHASTAALDATETALFGKPAKVVPLIQFEVDSAYQGQEGSILVKNALEQGRPYAMAFVDVRMPPGWDGVETTQKITEIDPEIQIVICTAYADYSWDEMCEKIGNRDGLLILKKPFDAVEALQLAHALTEKWWLHRQSRRKMEELESMVTTRTQELAKSLSMLNATLESTADGIVAVDLSGKIVSYNTRFAACWQFPTEMLARRDAAEMRAHTAGQVKDSAQFLQCIEQQAGTEAERFDVIELKDGRIFERYIFPQRIERVCVGTVINWRDVTAREWAENALRESEARKNAILESSLDCIVTINHEGKILEFNPAAEKVFGHARAEVLGRELAQIIIPPSLRERHRQGMKHYLATGETKVLGKRIEITAIRADGSEFPVELAISRLDAKGPPMFTGFIRDITERKRLEAQLLQSQKMETVGKLAGGVAHEFNSILTAIIGQSELLLNDLPAESPLTENATEIRKAADRAATLTRQLLAYGRKQLLTPKILDLNQIIASMERILQLLVGGNVATNILPAADLRLVKVDAGQIEQVIMNIVINAADAMPTGGRLTIETANIAFDGQMVGRYPELKPGEYVQVAISDTGNGMSEAVKARVFEPFFTTKDVGQGTGLGLSTCYGIIKQSGGHISVYSEPGRGTTFKIYLPQMEQPKEISVAPPVALQLPRGTETILLVEDDPALRDMATILLQRLGYTVWAAANGIEALVLKKKSELGHVDLLFTDVIMPHMSGKELADRVRMVYPHTKILFTSAYTENAAMNQGALDKGAALLQKPFTPSGLAHKVREVLDA
jgi:PAS domain S-box-containing protein